MIENIVEATDSYKFSHWTQYPPEVRYVRSYLEPRGGAYKNVVTFGDLQYFVQTVLLHPATRFEIDEAEDFVNEHMGPGIFNRKGWEHILYKHDGILPLKIQAAPEGLLIPTNNLLVRFENTDPEVPWLTNYYETVFYPWYPYTVATLSFHCRQIILGHLRQTGGPDEAADFMLHDFGYRGASSNHGLSSSAAIGGCAHLVNFKGSDTVVGIRHAKKFYGERMAAFSIPAAEHSTITSWGQKREPDAYRNMLTRFKGLRAVVSDSYDIYNAVEHLWGELLHDEVEKLDGTLVIRPDSGYPPEVVMKCLRILDQKFGTTMNQKGYRVLNPKVKLIQGDGVDQQMIDMVLGVMAINGYAAQNVAFGMGGALLQKVTRDTLGFAIKCMSVGCEGGEERDVFKSPVTDGFKRSKAGNLTLYRTKRDTYYTAPRGSNYEHDEEVLQTIYENGKTFNQESFDTIRARLRSYEREAVTV